MDDPLMADSFVQEAYLKASNPDEDDDFGSEVALYENTLVIAAREESGGATGVGADQSDNSLSAAGAVYVFVRSSSGWTQEAYIKSPSTGLADRFGSSISIWGDTLVVGAREEDSNARGVGGDPNDNSAVDSGAAYVYVRSDSTWSLQAYLKASNADPGDQFGCAVSVNGDRLVVGADKEASRAHEVNGDQTSNFNPTSGAAYVFLRDGDQWAQEAYLKASNSGRSDLFGNAVALHGDTLVVGAFLENGGARGVNGNQADNSANAAGAAYVFVRSDSGWNQEAYLKASNPGVGDQFGFKVACWGDTVVVGSIFEGGGATGVNGDQHDGIVQSGAVYVFVRRAGSWSQEAYLKSSNPGRDAYFGNAVSLWEDRLVVGAELESSGGNGVNPPPTATRKGFSGAAYVFGRQGSTWFQEAHLKPAVSGQDDFFGLRVALWENLIGITATGEDGGGSGTQGDPFDNQLDGAGAAYVFDFSTRGAVGYRIAGANASSYSAPAARLGQVWTPMVDLAGTSGHSFAFVFGSTSPLTKSLRHSQVLLVKAQDFSGGVFRLPPRRGPVASWSIELPGARELAGLVVYTQAVHFGDLSPFALSNAQDLLIDY